MAKTRSLLTRHRPETFAEVIGQDAAIAALKTALVNGAQVILLVGPSGTGKTTLARLAAAAVEAGQVIEIDAANYNSVDDMRELTAPYAYHLHERRAIIIDECPRLTPPAWTVLLKPLEEAPEGLYWFLLANELGRIPDNIRTRCTIIRLQDVGRDDLVDLLRKVCRKEGWKTPTEVLALCAQEAMGSPRRALTLLAGCSDCTTRPEAARLIAVPASDEPDSELGYRIAQALRVAKWPEIQALLKRVRKTGEPPESIRQVVRTYFAAIAIDDQDKRAVCYALKILDHFAEPVPDLPALVLVLGRIVFGEEKP